MKINKDIAIRVLIFIIVVLLIRLYFPEKSRIGNQNQYRENLKIVIIPMAGIPIDFKNSLRDALEEQHKGEVLVTTEFGRDVSMVLPGSGQYNSNLLASRGGKIAEDVGVGNAFIVVLTNEDINQPDSGLRYSFSAHYNGLSVVSLARINPQNFGVTLDLISIPIEFQIMKKRALKLLNKSIGYGLYGYEASSDINSVMYGPIMGIDDLDKVGAGF